MRNLDASRFRAQPRLGLSPATVRPPALYNPVDGPRPSFAILPQAERLASRIALLALATLSALSVATFNAALLPPSAGNLQQIVVLGLWLVVIAATMPLRPVRVLAFGTEFYAILGFYGFAVASVVWSDQSASTVLKALALSVTTLASLRVATRITVDDLVAAVSAGFIAVSLASLVVVFAWPAVGIDQTWMHKGQWQGVFESKQSLGTVGAFLMFFAVHRLLARGGWVRFGCVFGLALACVLGSQSRGAAAVALAACLILSVPGRWRAVMTLLGFGPLAIIAFAFGAIVYLLASGNAFLPLFGTEVDFTQRAIIWQYALSHFGEHPLLGYGLNGFWSIDAILHGFEREHGWALDNHHNGYIGILMETGLVGLALFAAALFLVGLKMRWLIGHRRMTRADITLIIGFLNLVFVIDLTETFFLRSTNINSVLMTTLLFVSCATGRGRPDPGR